MPTSLTVCICIYVYERVCVCEFPCAGLKCRRRRRRRHTLYLLNQPLKLLAQILLIFALYATKERAPKREPTERERARATVSIREKARSCSRCCCVYFRTPGTIRRRR